MKKISTEAYQALREALRPADVRSADNEHRQQEMARYRYVMSYDGLKRCLSLNDILDKQALLRLDAHYTFLGQYLHPTKDAMRGLHNDDNWHDGKPVIGKNSTYRQSAELLAGVYALQIATAFVREAVNFFDTQDSKWVRDPGTQDLHLIVDNVETRVPYFWFLTNEATDFDRFNWCIHWATDEQLVEWGGFRGAPTNLIKFNKHILGNVESGLGSYSNPRVGYYSPPV